ncbi:MAG: TIGR00730 family Rossman fold protein [Acidobacteriota bacterium]|jgi:uncharacterized protein (TIGR00730 family)
MKNICVFCGSNSGNLPEFAEGARALGETLARRGYGLVYGGASIGLMGALADAVLAGGGKVIGVIPGALADKEIAHRGLSELVVVDSMHERKARMMALSDGFIALPGGMGTMEEMFEVLTWAQLGIHRKPCGLLDVEGYFFPLLNFLDEATRRGFLRSHHRDMVLVSGDADELLDAFGAFQPVEVKKWLDVDET